MDESLPLLIVVYCSVSIAVALWIGKNKKLGFAGTLFICLLLSPVIGGLIAFFSKDKYSEDYYQEETALSLSDEIQKLSDLKDKGLITEEEFKKSKGKLLDL